RRVYLAPGTQIRMSDTVGFITNLPADLVNAFRATLEELREADLLLHVLDASNPHWVRQRRAVEAILHELQLDRTPRIVAFNKDDIAVPEVLEERDSLHVSAATGAGLAALRAALIEHLT
ncbi:MAG: 50S ribosome-binding GTPase, partial [Candidatus Eremiobacteraeota bacterium]|nr:50S ribosome-binding GTPase [Candidatus Eremiobacteraeota bacterium]